MALSLAALVGCQHLGSSPEACSGAIVRDRPAGAGSLHVRAAIERDGRTQRHEALVEISPETVTLIGLTPMGTQAYTLTLDETGIRRDDWIGRRMGLDAGALLDAVARAWLVPDEGAGERALVRSGERLRASAEGGWQYLDDAGDVQARVIVEGTSARVTSLVCGYQARLVRIDAAP